MAGAQAQGLEGALPGLARLLVEAVAQAAAVPAPADLRLHLLVDEAVEDADQEALPDEAQG